MNSKTSPMHGLVHAIMIIIIVGLLSLYFQLRIRFVDLSHTCENLQRHPRESSDFDNSCAGASDNMNSHGCFQNEDPSTATSPALLQVPSQLSSAASVNRREPYLQTDLTTDKLVSISVSESSFNLKHTPFETSRTLTVNEFDKTDENLSEVDDASTVCSTDVDLPSQISLVEITNVNLHEILKSQDSQKPRTIEAAVNMFPFKPSSTLEKQMKRKQDNAYSRYNDQQHSFEDDITTESDLIGSGETTHDSSVTGFSDAISLSISETSKGVSNLATKLSHIEMQNFGQTNLDINSYGDSFHDGAIYSTESACADYMFDCGYGCQSGSSDGCGDFEESRLQIEPIPPEVLSGFRSSDQSNILTWHGSHQDIYSVLKQAGASDIQTLLHMGTSAQCGSPYNDGSQTCHFENLCYKVKERDFIFLKGEHSVIKRQLNLEKVDSDDLFNISLSTLPDHNAFKFSPVFLPSQSLNRFPSVAILQGKSFILHRFKPDNIMHVLHDDILPLHYMLQSLDLIYEHTKPEVTLLLTDHFSIGEYASLYKSLSTITPVSLVDLNYVADVICFEDTHIGMSNSTLWYQYGFFKPQGPLKANSSNLLRNVHNAVKYLNKHFNYECMFCTSRNYMVLLSRKDNRLILNEGELMMSLARSAKLKVMSVSMETHSLEEIVSLIRSSRGIIGMHGSLLSFVIFLQPGTFVIELFPYAVNPSKYTPFKTFCDLPDSGIIYKSWANQNRDKSIPHPDWSSEMGGIHHLSHDAQQFIIDQSEVPDHLCCEDPSWLYHIYQDTEVDIMAVTSLTSEAFTEISSLQSLKINSKSATELVKDIPIKPGPVKNLSCKITDEVVDNKSIKYLLIWEIPWNLEFLEYRNLEFQLVISEAGNDSSVSVNLPFNVTFYSLEPTSQRQYMVYNVWVRVTVDNNFNGPYVFVTCKNNV